MDYQKVGQEIEFARDEDFYRRCKFALAKSAKTVLKEASDAPDHAARAAYAKAIGEGNYNLVPAMYLICTDPAIEGANRLNAVTDAQLQAAVDACFNVLAGIG